MALIKCDECGAKISSRATACPKCGNPTFSVGSAPAQKIDSSTKRTLGGILLGLLVAVIAVVVFAEWLSGNGHTKSINDTGTSQAVATAATDAASATAATEKAARAVSAADSKCAADLQCIADKYSVQANSQCEVMIDNRARQVAKWDYKVETEHWYTPFTSKISWGGPSHRRIVYYGDQAKFQNGFGAWQRQPYWCVFDIASQKVTAAQFDEEGLPPTDDAAADDRPQPSVAPASPALSGADANQAAPASPHPEQGGETTSATQPTETIEASFDCTKAHSTSEMLICGDPELAALDRDLAQMYAQAKAVAQDKHAFNEGTRQNWNWRERNCRDKACLVGWYADQKQRFTNIVNLAPPSDIGQVSAARPMVPQNVAGTSYPTSFDCSAPIYLDEKAICGDPGLAAMDMQMAAEYAAALKRTADPTKLESTQNDWHAVRRDCASDLNCLRRAYGVRINQLRQS